MYEQVLKSGKETSKNDFHLVSCSSILDTEPSNSSLFRSLYFLLGARGPTRLSHRKQSRPYEKKGDEFSLGQAEFGFLVASGNT